MIYGAYGYTGAMITEQLSILGQNIIVAGRDESKLNVIKEKFNVPSKVFSLGSEHELARILKDIDIIINCAGPFNRTVRPLMRAAIKNNTHYLDISAELDSYYLAEALDEEAKAAGVLLMPGCGGSVAMIGCLTAFAKKQMPNPVEARVALHVSGSMSRGSAISASDYLTPTLIVRHAHELTETEDSVTRTFNFGKGMVDCVPVSLPEVITLWAQNRIADISTYVHVSGEAFPTGDLSSLPAGPTEQERENNRYQAAVQLTDVDGNEVHAMLDTLNGYSVTPRAAALAVKNIANGNVKAGFRTPSEMFGSSFILNIPTTTMELIS
ncbi:hypothetical protein CA267_013400 [Alteromonas pelagimontana]|uniref:Saccharopine dehydrogenase NADP binding domain-containing protein n=1 Tax=Alteromonas pelagimontana TaxID=1858656 RepID=A0A6M4MIE2_9ALTE|nr:hypothetical protein CA267_013400 [Alteromonas pelagimontana]